MLKTYINIIQQEGGLEKFNQLTLAILQKKHGDDLFPSSWEQLYHEFDGECSLPFEKITIGDMTGTIDYLNLNVNWSSKYKSVYDFYTSTDKEAMNQYFSLYNAVMCCELDVVFDLRELNLEEQFDMLQFLGTRVKLFERIYIHGLENEDKIRDYFQEDQVKRVGDLIIVTLNNLRRYRDICKMRKELGLTSMNEKLVNNCVHWH